MRGHENCKNKRNPEKPLKAFESAQDYLFEYLIHKLRLYHSKVFSIVVNCSEMFVSRTKGTSLSKWVPKAIGISPQTPTSIIDCAHLIFRRKIIILIIDEEGEIPMMTMMMMMMFMMMMMMV